MAPTVSRSGFRRRAGSVGTGGTRLMPVDTWPGSLLFTLADLSTRRMRLQPSLRQRRLAARHRGDLRRYRLPARRSPSAQTDPGLPRRLPGRRDARPVRPARQAAPRRARAGPRRRGRRVAPRRRSAHRGAAVTTAAHGRPPTCSVGCSTRRSRSCCSASTRAHTCSRRAWPRAPSAPSASSSGPRRRPPPSTRW